MKFSENWLRTFVNPPLASHALADALTMSGLEVELVEPVAPAFDLDPDDQLFTIKPTPNRGDCLSVFGVAREVAAVMGCTLTADLPAAVQPTSSERIEIVLENKTACRCHLIIEFARERILQRHGHVSLARQAAIKRRLREIFGL